MFEVILFTILLAASVGACLIAEKRLDRASSILAVAMCTISLTMSIMSII